MPTNFEGPVTIDMPAGLDMAAVGGSSPSASTSGAGHPKLRLEMVSQVILRICISRTCVLDTLTSPEELTVKSVTSPLIFRGWWSNYFNF